jgi:hypothetical protein
MFIDRVATTHFFKHNQRLTQKETTCGLERRKQSAKEKERKGKRRRRRKKEGEGQGGRKGKKEEEPTRRIGFVFYWVIEFHMVEFVSSLVESYYW